MTRRVGHANLDPSGRAFTPVAIAPHDALRQRAASPAFLTGYAERGPGTARARLTIMRRSTMPRSSSARVPGLTADDSRKAIAFTFGCLKLWGYTVDQTDPAMLWVNTGSHEIGCAGVADLVTFVSEELKSRSTRTH